MPRRSSGDRRRGMALPLLWYPRTIYRPPEALDPDLARRHEAVWEARAPADWPVQVGSLMIDVAVAEVTERLRGKRRVIVGLILGGALGVPWAKLVAANRRDPGIAEVERRRSWNRALARAPETA